MTRSKLERDANDFDADLYRLVDRAYQYADRYPAKSTAWLKIAGMLSGQRPDVRMMMHSHDRDTTDGSEPCANCGQHWASHPVSPELGCPAYRAPS